MKAVVAAFNQEKALVGAFSVPTNLRMELFQALKRRPQFPTQCASGRPRNMTSVVSAGACFGHPRHRSQPIVDNGRRKTVDEDTIISVVLDISHWLSYAAG